MIERVVRRFLAALLVNREVAEELASRPGLSPITVRKLKSLANDFEWGGLEPFLFSDLREYLIERGAPEEEVEILLSKPPKPAKKKGLSWEEAYSLIGRETGKSIVFEGSLQHDPNAPASIAAWVKAFKAMKPKAKAIFQRVVKKVRLKSPRGTEDASWESGGVIALSAGRSLSPSVGASYITHELGHGVENEKDVRGGPWGDPPFVSDYAESKPLIEDFAESFRVYIEHPSELRQVSPEKFEAMKRLVG